MRYLAILAVLFMAACGDSGGPAGNAPSGAAGMVAPTGAAGAAQAGASGAAGAGAAGTGDADMCKSLPPCDHGETPPRSTFSSPTCPGRICGECTNADHVVIHDCYVADSAGNRVYCDNRGLGTPATDCN